MMGLTTPKGVTRGLELLNHAFTSRRRVPEPGARNRPGRLPRLPALPPQGRCPPPAPTARSARSSAPSQRATTIVATPLPIRFVIALASDMNRSIPSSSARPATGTFPVDSIVCGQRDEPAAGHGRGSLGRQ